MWIFWNVYSCCKDFYSFLLFFKLVGRLNFYFCIFYSIIFGVGIGYLYKCIVVGVFVKGLWILVMFKLGLMELVKWLVYLEKVCCVVMLVMELVMLFGDVFDCFLRLL